MTSTDTPTNHPAPLELFREPRCIGLLVSPAQAPEPGARMGSRNAVFLQMGWSGLSGKSLRWIREGLAHQKRNTRAYLHGKKIFY